MDCRSLENARKDLDHAKLERELGTARLELATIKLRIHQVGQSFSDDATASQFLKAMGCGDGYTQQIGRRDHFQALLWYFLTGRESYRLDAVTEKALK